MNTYQGFNKIELSTPDPIDLFRKWFEEAKLNEINDPDAMALATVDRNNAPNIRMVLVKKIDHGLIFYTNKKSQKGSEINLNKNAALCFHWKSIRKQVRFRGAVSMITADESDEYFQSRPRGSRIGAIVSKQSSTLKSQDQFAEEYKSYEVSMEGKEIIRPDYWVGYRLEPIEVEFWLNSEFRLHQRMRFSKINKNWEKEFLYP